MGVFGGERFDDALRELEKLRAENTELREDREATRDRCSDLQRQVSDEQDNVMVERDKALACFKELLSRLTDAEEHARAVSRRKGSPTVTEYWRGRAEGYRAAAQAIPKLAKQYGCELTK